MFKGASPPPPPKKIFFQHCCISPSLSLSSCIFKNVKDASKMLDEHYTYFSPLSFFTGHLGGGGGSSRFTMRPRQKKKQRKRSACTLTCICHYQGLATRPTHTHTHTHSARYASGHRTCHHVTKTMHVRYVPTMVWSAWHVKNFRLRCVLVGIKIM